MVVLTAVMRALADGRVKWGYWPQGVDVDSRSGFGIWLSGETTGLDETEDKTDKEDAAGTYEGQELSEWDDEDYASEISDSDQAAEKKDEAGEGEEVESEDEDGDQEGDEAVGQGKGGGFFAALQDSEPDSTTDDESAASED